jgi:hypothetical protein
VATGHRPPASCLMPHASPLPLLIPLYSGCPFADDVHVGATTTTPSPPNNNQQRNDNMTVAGNHSWIHTGDIVI